MILALETKEKGERTFTTDFNWLIIAGKKNGTSKLYGSPAVQIESSVFSFALNIPSWLQATYRGESVGEIIIN